MGRELQPDLNDISVAASAAGPAAAAVAATASDSAATAEEAGVALRPEDTSRAAAMRTSPTACCNTIGQCSLPAPLLPAELLDDGQRVAKKAQAAYMSSSIFEQLRTPAVRDLESLDDEHLAIRREHEAELCELRRKFGQKYNVLLERRRALLTGADAHLEDHADNTRMPATSSTGGSMCSSSSRKPAAPRRAVSTSGTPALPGFWRIAMQNSDEFQEDIQTHDELVLDYLRDIQIQDVDESGDRGFRISFIFEPNPFFSNAILEKVVYSERRTNYMHHDIHFSLTSITSTTIDWYPGQNVTVDTVAKKPRGGRRRPTKTRKEEVPRPSFFRSFFRRLGPHEEIPEEELGDSEEEVEPEELMNYLMHHDYEQALFLRHILVPHAVRWYTGEACSDNEKTGDGAENDSSDEDEDDDTEDGALHGESPDTENEDAGGDLGSHGCSRYGSLRPNRGKGPRSLRGGSIT